MAYVPSYDNYQVRPDFAPKGQAQKVEAIGTVGNIGAVQAVQTGEQAKAWSNDLFNEAIKLQQEANQLRVDDAYNQLKEWELKHTYDQSVGYTYAKGINALQRESGKTLTDEYSHSMQEEISRIQQGLGNDAQRALFAQKAEQAKAGFNERLMRHESQEYRQYAISVSKGNVEQGLRELALSYGDAQQRQESLLRVKAHTYRLGQMSGKSATEIESDLTQTLSGAHKVVVESAIKDGNVDFAEQYLKRYAADMTANDLLSGADQVEKAVDHNTAKYAVSQASEAGIQAFAPSLLDDLKQVTQTIQDKQASKTLVNPQELELNIKHFGGDIQKALAASYLVARGENGQKLINEAVQQAKQAGDELAWTQYLDKTTLSFTQEAQAEYEKRQNQPPQLPQWEQIKKQAYRLANVEQHPKRKELIDKQVAYQQRAWENQHKQMLEQNRMTVYHSIDELGSYAELPPHILRLIPLGERDKFMKYSDRINKGHEVSNEVAYLKMTDDALLKTYTEAQVYALRSELSEKDWQYFTKRWRSLQSGDQRSRIDQVDHSAVDRALKPRLTAMDLNTQLSPKNKDIGKVNTLNRLVIDQILSEQERLGRQLSSKEIEVKIDEVLMSKVNAEGFWGITESSVTDLKYSDVPSAAKREIEKAYADRGLTPSEQDVVRVYIKHSLEAKRNTAQQGKE